MRSGQKSFSPQPPYANGGYAAQNHWQGNGGFQAPAATWPPTNGWPANPAGGYISPVGKPGMRWKWTAFFVLAAFAGGLVVRPRLEPHWQRLVELANASHARLADAYHRLTNTGAAPSADQVPMARAATETPAPETPAMAGAHAPAGDIPDDASKASPPPAPMPTPEAALATAAAPAAADIVGAAPLEPEPSRRNRRASSRHHEKMEGRARQEDRRSDRREVRLAAAREAAKSEAKSEAKPEAKSETKSEAKSEAKSDSKGEPAQAKTTGDDPFASEAEPAPSPRAKESSRASAKMRPTVSPKADPATASSERETVEKVEKPKRTAPTEAEPAPADSLDGLMAGAVKHKSADNEIDRLLKSAPASKKAASPEPDAPEAPPKSTVDSRPPLNRDQIIGVMKSLQPEISDCAQSLEASSVADLQLAVDPGGAVTAVKLAGPLFATRVGGCVVKAVKRAKFPPSGGMRFPYRLTVVR